MTSTALVALGVVACHIAIAGLSFIAGAGLNHFASREEYTKELERAAKQLELANKERENLESAVKMLRAAVLYLRGEQLH